MPTRFGISQPILYLMAKFLSKEDRQKIDELTTDTCDVQRRKSTEPPKVRRTKEVYDCPQCGAADGLEIVASGAKKGVFKCFHCDLGGKGGASILQVMHGMDWKAAYNWLAEQYHYQLPDDAPKTTREANKAIAAKKVTFRDLQLKHSGIPNEAQICPQIHGNTTIETNRYTSGAMTDQGEYTADGADMILQYVGLDCKPIIFTPKKGKAKPLIRVRYQHPDLHKDKDGKPIKYRSPYDSGSHLWLPMHIIKAYQKAQKVKTLYVVEGEKKADKMCLHGLDAVAIMGIHNLAFNTEMPRTFELIITKCEVEEVVFVLDSDWQDLAATTGKPVDIRPRTFMRAVQKFREYFYGYRNSGIDLRIFMLAGKSTEHKGMDDLLAALEAAGHETLYQSGFLASDVTAALTAADGQAQQVEAYNIHPLRVSEYQLSERWHLHDPSAFFKKHFDKLKELGEFKYKNITYFFNADTSEIQMAQQILPAERFWDIEEYMGKGGRWVKDVKFNYDRIRRFLFNRGIGLYEYSTGLYRTVRAEGHLLADVTPQWIQRFVVEFAENSVQPDERSDVVQMLLRGNTQFLGPNNLNYMYLHNPKFVATAQEQQIMVFNNCYWIITAEKIEQRPLTELDGMVWQNQIINFAPQYLGHPIVEVSRNDKGWQVKEAPECNGDNKCEMFDYLRCTSLFAWEKLYELRRDTDGVMKYFYRDDEAEKMTAEELNVWKMHIATKMIAWGYKLRDYRDPSNMRAVICMDGLESAVGKSQGGSGKSIYAFATQHCQPLFAVDGKNADIKNDRFLYHGVDERTKEIVFDDINVNFSFEQLFYQITNGIRVKPFQGAPITIPSPVITLTTNHSLNGEGNSFKRRQYYLGFSNFFNEHRTPAHYFGHQLFADWDHRQWNLYYNLMATCIQTYMRFSDLGRYAVESSDIERRKLRQQIGEDFLDFADTYFSKGFMLNRMVAKDRILNDYLGQYPNDRKWMDATRIKNRAQLYAKYAGLLYNPCAGPDGRIKSSGTEFIVVANNDFDANNCGEKIYLNTAVEFTDDVF